MLFCEFPSADVEYPRRFAQAMREAYPSLPLYFNYSSNLKWHELPLATFDALADMGYRAIHVSQGCLRPSMQAVWDYAVDLRQRGAQAEIDLERRLLRHPMGPHHEFAGVPAFKELEAKYLPAEEVKRKYDGAVGL